ncbi:MAG: hypothetical protein NTV60_01005 [Candidatus Kaiserbacteria bacterium]|nr:hypothetical protein [Candidatus Kaiserbacteria bacterium]
MSLVTRNVLIALAITLILSGTVAYAVSSQSILSRLKHNFLF